LESLGRIAQTEGHEGKLEETERCSDGGLRDISGMYRNLVVRSDKIDFREDATTRKLMGIVVDMTDWVAVGDGT
jgi:hypothetical protein